MTSLYDASPGTCPTWCTRRHGENAGEEDLVHISDSVFVRNTMIRLCTSIDPATGMQDGPYVLVGSEEYSLTETSTLVDVLTNLLSKAAIPRAAV
jgi:hypothetical protein